MNILVTGGTGFVGKNLLSALYDRGHQAICAVRPTSNTAQLQDLGVAGFVDIDNDTALVRAMSSCSAVIHLAGQMGAYGVSSETYYATNCALTERLVTLAVGAKVSQFIFCSTPGVYGFGGRLRPETAPYAPRNDYEKTKADAEHTIISICRGTETAYTILRPDFVYGPGDTRRVKMYRNIAQHKFILTTSGKSYLHPTYIKDVVQGFVLCLEKPQARNQIFNIAGETDVTSEEYLRTVSHVFGGGVRYVS